MICFFFDIFLFFDSILSCRILIGTGRQKPLLYSRIVYGG